MVTFCVFCWISMLYLPRQNDAERPTKYAPQNPYRTPQEVQYSDDFSMLICLVYWVVLCWIFSFSRIVPFFSISLVWGMLGGSGWMDHLLCTVLYNWVWWWFSPKSKSKNCVSDCTYHVLYVHLYGVIWFAVVFTFSSQTCLRNFLQIPYFLFSTSSKGPINK